MNAPRSFYKLDIQGIVYLVDPVTSRAYTYDLEDPTEIGIVSWTDPKAKPILTLRSDWRDVLIHKQTTMTHKFAVAHTAPTPVSHDDATSNHT